MSLIDIIGLTLLTLVQVGLAILSYQEFTANNFVWAIGYFAAVCGMYYLEIL